MKSRVVPTKFSTHGYAASAEIRIACTLDRNGVSQYSITVTS